MGMPKNQEKKAPTGQVLKIIQNWNSRVSYDRTCIFTHLPLRVAKSK